MNENKVSPLAIASLLSGIACLLFLFFAIASNNEGVAVFSGFLGIGSLLVGIWDLTVGLIKGLKNGLNVKLALSGIFISLIVLAFLFGFSLGVSKGYSDSIRDNNYLQNNY